MDVAELSKEIKNKYGTNPRRIRVDCDIDASSSLSKIDRNAMAFNLLNDETRRILGLSKEDDPKSYMENLIVFDEHVRAKNTYQYAIFAELKFKNNEQQERFNFWLNHNYLTPEELVDNQSN